MENIDIHAAGHAGEGFSVEREQKKIIDEHKIKKSYFVLLTDNANRRLGKTEKLVHYSYCYREPIAKKLYESLIEMGLKDLGMKKEPKNPLVHVYIIDKGSVSHYANRVVLPDL